MLRRPFVLGLAVLAVACYQGVPNADAGAAGDAATDAGRDAGIAAGNPDEVCPVVEQVLPCPSRVVVFDGTGCREVAGCVDGGGFGSVAQCAADCGKARGCRQDKLYGPWFATSKHCDEIGACMSSPDAGPMAVQLFPAISCPNSSVQDHCYVSEPVCGRKASLSLTPGIMEAVCALTWLPDVRLLSCRLYL